MKAICQPTDGFFYAFKLILLERNGIPAIFSGMKYYPN